MLPADYGDALWLEYGDDPKKPRVVVIDGGPSRTYESALRPRIEDHRARTGGTPEVELLVVTHIDNDHIVGPLALLDDDRLDVRIGEVWFNGWDQLVSADLMGEKEGVALSKAIKRRKIKHNAVAGKKAIVDPGSGRPPTHRLPGGLELTVLSPGLAQLKKLRDEWDAAIAESEPEPPKDLLGGAIETDVRKLAAAPFKSDAAPANGSSIVLLAEYDGRRLLLAADSFAPVVAAALGRLGATPSKRLRLDGYKVSHHGSRGNNSSDLLDLVDCRIYLFSTSGNRFRHPHDECVARVLVHGGPDLHVHSNYPREGDVLWNHPAVKSEFKHTVCQPGAAGGIAVDFN
jgi:beta-lactamase superfamily II metal-dependent hydrolase